MSGARGGSPLLKTYRLWPGDRTLRAFVGDVSHRVLGFKGPIGGGKTTAALMRFMNKTMRTPPTYNGLRQRRSLVVRDTYRNLDRTTINSWKDWYPPDQGQWRGGKGEPSEHELRWPMPDGSECFLHVDFVALGDHAIEDVCRGFEISDAFINEGDRTDRDAVTYLNGRIGRWPGPELGGCWSPQVWLDFNAPDIDNYTYELFVEDLPEGWAFYSQPGGLDPDAENLQNLNQTPETLALRAAALAGDPKALERIREQGRNYYHAQIAGQPKWYVRRMIHNEFGFSREGDPVYENYDDDVHCARKEIRPDPSLPVFIGADAGRTPAAEFAQITPDGQLIGITELCMKNASAEVFGPQLANVMQNQFGSSYDFPAIFCDPSAFDPHDTGEAAWAEIVEEKTEVRCVPARSNTLQARISAVDARLMRFLPTDGRNVPKNAVSGPRGRPAMLISPAQRVLRRGFNSGYMFTKVKVGNTERLRDVPAKSMESHPHDAWQYLCLEISEEQGRMSRVERRNMALDIQGRSAQSDYHVFDDI